MTVCTECHQYQLFKEKCWFYWEDKRACSQFRATAVSEPNFFSVETLQGLLRHA